MDPINIGLGASQYAEGELRAEGVDWRAQQEMLEGNLPNNTGSEQDGLRVGPVAANVDYGDPDRLSHGPREEGRDRSNLGARRGYVN